jgi:hypothetical protein
MIRAGATGRVRGYGARSHATTGPASAALVGLALLGALIAACGPTGPTGSAGASSPSPIAPASPGASGSTGGARPTPWPGNSVLGIEALGVADGQIGAAVTDLNLGIAEEDLVRMRKAADGLSHVGDDLLPNMEKLRLNPAMVPFADRYEAAITSIDDAATRLRDSIDAGDAAAIGAATEDVFAGLAAYTALKPELADWIRQMPEQKRMLLN